MGLKPSAPLDVRKEVAGRLRQEMDRKGVDGAKLARIAELAPSVVTDYLDARREIRFDELRPICAALSLRLMRLLAPKFGDPQLQYRGSTDIDRQRVSQIENAFLAVADLLPKPQRLNVRDIDHNDGEISMLLAGTRAAAQELQSKYPTVEALYQAARLPILPLPVGAGRFDAFLMTAGDRAVVCVNVSQPPVRLHFSLLHEMAHFLWHRGRALPIDTLTLDLYQDRIAQENRPEYVANKFAQLYLVPWEDAEQKARQWKQLPDQAGYLAERRASADVLASAIYDCMRFSGRPPAYTEVRDTIKAHTSEYRAGDALRDFVEKSGQSLRAQLFEHRESFADEVWADIATAWELPRD